MHNSTSNSKDCSFSWIDGWFCNTSLSFQGNNPDNLNELKRKKWGKSLLNPCKHLQEHGQGRKGEAHGLQGYLEMKLYYLLLGVFQASCHSLIFYFMVAIGFRWWKAVGFSLLLSLCAEGPRCRRCLRHLLGLPNHTCHPHPRTASSFGGWGCRGAVHSSHLGRDQESKKVKPLLKPHYICQLFLQVWNGN